MTTTFERLVGRVIVTAEMEIHLKGSYMGFVTANEAIDSMTNSQLLQALVDAEQELSEETWDGDL